MGIPGLSALNREIVLFSRRFKLLLLIAGNAQLIYHVCLYPYAELFLMSGAATVLCNLLIKNTRSTAAAMKPSYYRTQ